nr:hypothetical protein [Rhodococcus sp. (in: high G+C Gram-positive bacteria)]
MAVLKQMAGRTGASGLRVMLRCAPVSYYMFVDAYGSAVRRGQAESTALLSAR